jgi:hypothetical protein
MGIMRALFLLGVAVGALAACDSGSEQNETKKEHVWKEQTGAIDKAREVETILQRNREQQQQQEQQQEQLEEKPKE